jgi:tetratricopeptide (TPR) repeat protein
MRTLFLVSLAGFVAIPLALLQTAACDPFGFPPEGGAGSPPGETLQIPGFPPIPLPPKSFGFGGPPLTGDGMPGLGVPPRGQEALGRRGKSDKPKTETRAPSAKTAEEKAEELKKALAPRPAPAVVRSQMLDRFFKRLQAASDEEEAKGLAAMIQHVWQHSDSDTANLLMERAALSLQARQYPLALSLLDKIVALQPDWAEAWNQRATARFLADDNDGAMADIDEVLKREPRHFGALTGMGMILQKAGLDKRALEIFRKVLAIYPHQPEIEKIVEKLTLQVEGRDI